MSKFVVSGMRYDFPKPSNIGVSENPLRAMNFTPIKLAKVLSNFTQLLLIPTILVRAIPKYHRIKGNAVTIYTANHAFRVGA
jgi:hypothetical protein